MAGAWLCDAAGARLRLAADELNAAGVTWFLPPPTPPGLTATTAGVSKAAARVAEAAWVKWTAAAAEDECHRDHAGYSHGGQHARRLQPDQTTTPSMLAYTLP